MKDEEYYLQLFFLVASFAFFLYATFISLYNMSDAEKRKNMIFESICFVFSGTLFFVLLGFRTGFLK